MNPHPEAIPENIRRAMLRKPAFEPVRINHSFGPAAKPAQIYAHDQIHCPRKDAKPKCPAGDATLGETQVQVGAGGRILIRLTSVRKRLLDEDNLVSKYHTDLCRYAGLLPADSPGILKIETGQRKAAKGEEEKTEIEITYPGEK